MQDRTFLDIIGIVENTNKSMLEADFLRHYAEFFAPYRDQLINVIEIGVSDGGSLRTWERYFSAATIVGIDVNEKCKQFEHGRVKVEIGSQADAALLDQIIANYPAMSTPQQRARTGAWLSGAAGRQ